MSRIERLLDEYGESHRNPVNKLIHWICVPLIVWSLMGLLWSLETPPRFGAAPVPLNWAVLVSVLAMLYYLAVSLPLAAGILAVFLLMLGVLGWLEQTGLTLWKFSLAVFVIAWIGQFIGHLVEGRRPSFFKDLQFLLVGPLWLLSFIYRKLGIRY